MPYNWILKERRDFCRCQIIKSLRISNSYKKVIFLKISNIHSSNCQTFLARLAKLLQDCVFRSYITRFKDFYTCSKNKLKNYFKSLHEKYLKATSELHQFLKTTSLEQACKDQLLFPLKVPGTSVK